MQAAIAIDIAQYLYKNPPQFELFELLKSIDNLELEELLELENEDCFNLDNINYFDLFYKDKSLNTTIIIEYIDKSTFFL